MLELLDREFKTTMTNRLKALIEKADMFRQMSNVSREIKTVNQNAIIEMKNVFVDRLDTAKGRISELEDRSKNC